MPFASEAQRRAMYAARDGNSKVGIAKPAASSFIKHSKQEPLPTVMHSTGTKSRVKDAMLKRKMNK